jgi:hypothetical protein
VADAHQERGVGRVRHAPLDLEVALVEPAEDRLVVHRASMPRRRGSDALVAGWSGVAFSEGHLLDLGALDGRP